MTDLELMNIYANHHHRQLARYGFDHPRSVASYRLRVYYLLRYYNAKVAEGRRA